MAAQDDIGRQCTEDEDTEEFGAHRPITADRGGSGEVRRGTYVPIPVLMLTVCVMARML